MKFGDLINAKNQGGRCFYRLFLGLDAQKQAVRINRLLMSGRFSLSTFLVSVTTRSINLSSNDPIPFPNALH
jgi:hypothetical protein